MLDADGATASFTTEGEVNRTINNFDPFAFFRMPNSAPAIRTSAPHFYNAYLPGGEGSHMVFNSSDSISLLVANDTARKSNWADSRTVSNAFAIPGAAFAFSLLDPGYRSNWRDGIDHIRHFSMISRHGGGANSQALWEFSTIAPQPSKVPLYGTSIDKTAKQVAENFFLRDQPLPNRRITPHQRQIDQALLDSYFAEAGKYSDGLADKIAAHLMVEGAFNINSTSVEAWKALLASLKGKPIAFLDGGITPKEATTTETPLTAGILPNAKPIMTSDIVSPATPPEQWKTGRVLTDNEIDLLAKAIVKQVKLRRPFLSLSEFVNRRLDADPQKLPLSLKGAVQAALDDDTVPINANFRDTKRKLDSETAGIVGFAFPEAAKGPIAYGSMAYVDQADVLRHFSEQLTPRGDSFVIRAYGDSVGANGEIIARAWCEAVVQRVPEYCDTTNLPHEKQAALSASNKEFGRKLKIIGFRWLNSDEI
jgi:hypothetical protein